MCLVPPAPALIESREVCGSDTEHSSYRDGAVIAVLVLATVRQVAHIAGLELENASGLFPPGTHGGDRL